MHDFTLDLRAFKMGRGTRQLLEPGAISLPVAILWKGRKLIYLGATTLLLDLTV